MFLNFFLSSFNALTPQRFFFWKCERTTGPAFPGDVRCGGFSSNEAQKLGCIAGWTVMTHAPRVLEYRADQHHWKVNEKQNCAEDCGE